MRWGKPTCRRRMSISQVGIALVLRFSSVLMFFLVAGFWYENFGGKDLRGFFFESFFFVWNQRFVCVYFILKVCFWYILTSPQDLSQKIAVGKLWQQRMQRRSCLTEVALPNQRFSVVACCSKPGISFKTVGLGALGTCFCGNFFSFVSS